MFRKRPAAKEGGLAAVNDTPRAIKRREGPELKMDIRKKACRLYLKLNNSFERMYPNYKIAKALRVSQSTVAKWAARGNWDEAIERAKQKALLLACDEEQRMVHYRDDVRNFVKGAARARKVARGFYFRDVSQEDMAKLIRSMASVVIQNQILSDTMFQQLNDNPGLPFMPVAEKTDRTHYDVWVEGWQRIVDLGAPKGTVIGTNVNVMSGDIRMSDNSQQSLPPAHNDYPLADTTRRAIIHELGNQVNRNKGAAVANMEGPKDSDFVNATIILPEEIKDR